MSSTNSEHTFMDYIFEKTTGLPPLSRDLSLYMAMAMI